MKRKNGIAPIGAPGIPQRGRESEDIYYIDECRAKYGSEVYPIDRFVEVFQVEENVWALKATGPSKMLDGNWQYLIEGPERALCIDNGYGVGNLKGLCEQLVHGKEVLCAVTHSHIEHASGSHQWDKIYSHKFCADNLEKNQATGNDHFLGSNMDKKGRRSIIKDEDLVPVRPYACVHMENHECINLGEDYDIELIHVGGHTPGLAVFLDKKGRALYTGDAAFEQLDVGLGIGLDLRGEKGRFLHEGYMDIHYYAEQLNALAERIDEYDVCRDGHGSIDSPSRVIPDLRDAIYATIEDPHAYTQEIKGWFGTSYIMTRGIANCRYNDPDTVVDMYILDETNK